MKIEFKIKNLYMADVLVPLYSGLLGEYKPESDDSLSKTAVGYNSSFPTSPFINAIYLRWPGDLKESRSFDDPEQVKIMHF